MTAATRIGARVNGCNPEQMATIWRWVGDLALFNLLRNPSTAGRLLPPACLAICQATVSGMIQTRPLSASAPATLFSVKYRIVEHTIRATDLARNLGDVLSRVRYRRDSFVIKRNGKPVARMVPIEQAADAATLAEVLTVWCDGAAGDETFATDLDLINSSDRPPTNRWES